MTFRYHPDIVARFPEITGGVILAAGLKNPSSPDALQSEFRAEQQAAIARIGKKPLSEIESLAAWRGVFRGFGVDPTQYRSAGEALLRRLTKQGNIPGINLLVDIGNLVSIRYALPVAIFDTQAVQGTIAVRFAAGSESFTPLGGTAPEHPELGEVIFVDDNQLVLARRWCWRQSDESAARETTTNVVITVEAHHNAGQADVKAALDDLCYLLGKYARNSVKKIQHSRCNQSGSERWVDLAHQHLIPGVLRVMSIVVLGTTGILLPSPGGDSARFGLFCCECSSTDQPARFSNGSQW